MFGCELAFEEFVDTEGSGTVTDLKLWIFMDTERLRQHKALDATSHILIKAYRNLFVRLTIYNNVEILRICGVEHAAVSCMAFIYNDKI